MDTGRSRLALWVCFILSISGLSLLACQSHKGTKPVAADAAASEAIDGTGPSQTGGGGATAIGSGSRAGSEAGGAGGRVQDGGVGGSARIDGGVAKDAAPNVDGARDLAGESRPVSTVPSCSPGLTVEVPFTGRSEVSCSGRGRELGVPNGEATYAKTFVLPSPLLAGADNALSFELTGAGPFNFELWGTDTVCKADELLWWGPFGAGTQCAQFRPSKPFANVLFVYRKMYAVSYSFGTPSETLCPGGTCPGGTTGTGKMTEAPLTAPLGNYALTGFTQIVGGWEIALGYLGRMMVAHPGDIKEDGVAQPLAGGVFRMPTTDPYGDAWYCIGEGSTLTRIEEDGIWFKGVQFSLRNITRLEDCGDTPGNESLSATITPSQTSGTNFVADLGGTISSWAGSSLPATQSCAGKACTFRFGMTSLQHYVYATVSADPSSDAVNPVAIESANWLFQNGKQFSMACSKSGSVLYRTNATTTLALSKVNGPRACPGTPIANDRLDFMADR